MKKVLLSIAALFTVATYASAQETGFLNKDDQAGVSLKSTETSRTKAGAHQVF